MGFIFFFFFFVIQAHLHLYISPVEFDVSYLSIFIFIVLRKTNIYQNKEVKSSCYSTRNFYDVFMHSPNFY